MACLQQGTKECQQQLCCSGISVRTGPPVEGPRRHIAELIASAGGLGNAEGGQALRGSKQHGLHIFFTPTCTGQFLSLMLQVSMTSTGTNGLLFIAAGCSAEYAPAPFNITACCRCP